jgi:hypothetical protein
MCVENMFSEAYKPKFSNLVNKILVVELKTTTTKVGVHIPNSKYFMN